MLMKSGELNEPVSEFCWLLMNSTNEMKSS